MKPIYIVLFVITSLAIGAYATYEFFYMPWTNDVFEYVLLTVIGLLLSALTFFIIYLIVYALETEMVHELSGKVIDKLIKGESKSESMILISGVPHYTTTTNAAEFLLKVRENVTNRIITLEVSEEFFYNEAKVGMTVKYEESIGVITDGASYTII